MTSPYLERPCRPLEEAKRAVGPRNWGIPPQPRVYTAAELIEIAERFDTYGEVPQKLDRTDKAIILLLSAAIVFSTTILFFLAYWQ